MKWIMLFTLAICFTACANTDIATWESYYFVNDGSDNRIFLEEKKEAYVRLHDFYTTFHELKQKENSPDEINGIANISFQDTYNGFTVDLTQPASETDLPAFLEECGFEGISAFFMAAENNKDANRHLYLNDDLFADIIYSIAPSPMIVIHLRQYLSLPTDYLPLIETYQEQGFILDSYSLAGNQDVLVFSNANFIKYQTITSWKNDMDKESLVSEYPVKLFLYGEEGQINEAIMLVSNPYYENFKQEDFSNLNGIFHTLQLPKDAIGPVISNINNCAHNKPYEKEITAGGIPLFFQHVHTSLYYTPTDIAYIHIRYE